MAPAPTTGWGAVKLIESQSCTLNRMIKLSRFLVLLLTYLNSRDGLCLFLPHKLVNQDGISPESLGCRQSSKRSANCSKRDQPVSSIFLSREFDMESMLLNEA